MLITAARFKELKQDKRSIRPEEIEAFNRLLIWEHRSDAAKRAVATKRAKYKTWPSRKGRSQ